MPYGSVLTYKDGSEEFVIKLRAIKERILKH